jgi:hypothetical protein
VSLADPAWRLGHRIVSNNRLIGDGAFSPFDPYLLNDDDNYRTIDVIVYYLDGKNGPSSWQTRGWFSVEPGIKKHVVDTHNRYIYFYAETPSDKKKIWTGDLPQWFEGNRYRFFKVDMGTNLEDFTYTFDCKKQ